MSKKFDRLCNYAITVSDLMKQLRRHDPDAVVIFSDNYGDTCNTIQALPVTSCRPLEEWESLYETDYSESGAAICDNDEDSDDLRAIDARNFVILGSDSSG